MFELHGQRLELSAEVGLLRVLLSASLCSQRLEFAQHGRDQLGDCGVNVHRVRE
jgi:hypothetical protein